MKTSNRLLIILLLVFVQQYSNAQINQQLSHLIDSLYKADQGTALIRPSDSAAAAYQRVIRSNFPLVKKILNEHGFPGYQMVGKESSGNYFLLVQHSDFDVAFQKRVLPLMKAEVDNNNASGATYAYLVDRINLNEGREQVYGTQVIMEQSGTRLKPCMDTINLDKRRLAVGLSPIKDYLKKCDEVFFEMNKDRMKPTEKQAVDSIKKNER
ncbi:MAG TPA: hypothetical protein PKC54_11600 [Ferruginibacter sp.]|nr:hypothetical protein [Ferruginibacter sp.]